MKKMLRLAAFWVLFFAVANAFGQNGTADGTYDFRSLGASNSAGTGFKKQGDKFAISNTCDVDTRDNSFYYTVRGASKGLQADVVIKAEGGAVCRRFTLKDMELYSFAGSYYKKWPYTKFTITLRNESGGIIASHQIGATVEIGAGGILRLKDIPFTVAWPAVGYAAVARIELSYIAENEYPEVLGFKSMSVTNISAGTLPVSFGTISAKIQSGLLKVEWTTLSETNNDRFVVQGSANGVDWTDLGTVVSKVAEATSAGTLSYSFSTPIEVAALAGFGLLGLLLLPAGKNRWFRLAIFAITLAVLFNSCAKETNGLKQLNEGTATSKVTYVRIAQIDKDGKTTYSDAVAAKK